MPQNRPNPAPIEDRKSKVYKCALDGMSVRATAAELGISPTRVHELLTEAINEIPQLERTAHRWLAVERVLALYVKLNDRIDMEGAEAEKVGPVILKAEERLARLLGLDEQPEQTPIVQAPSGNGFARIVSEREASE